MKRILSFALACIFVFACTACKTQTVTSDTKSAASGSSAAGTTTTTEKKEEVFKSKYENLDYDMGGRVIKIANPKWWQPTNENVYMDELIKRINYYQDKWNFKIEYVYPAGESSEYHSLINTSVLSGKPLADIAYVESGYLFPGYMSGGIVQNVSDLGVFDFTSKKWLIDEMNSLTKYKDKYYGLNVKGFNVSGYTDLGWGVFFNKDYFEEKSLPNLYDLVRKGEWTWDKMIEVAKAATTETDGKKTYGLAIWQDAFPFIASSGQKLVLDNGDGTYKFNGASSGVIKALEYYFNNAATTLPFNTEKYPWIHPHTGKWDFAMASFMNNETAMCMCAWSCLDWYFGGLSFDWGFLPLPKPNSDGKYSSYTLGSSHWCLLKNINKPKDVAMVFDAITDAPVKDDDYVYFYENKTCDDDTVDMIGTLLNQGVITYEKMNDFPKLIDSFWSAWNSVREGKATPTSAMQSISASEQKIIDEVVKQLKSGIK